MEPAGTCPVRTATEVALKQEMANDILGPPSMRHLKKREAGGKKQHDKGNAYLICRFEKGPASSPGCDPAFTYLEQDPDLPMLTMISS